MGIKLKDIFNKNDENKLVLPDFQRDFVWDKDQQKNLLASFMTCLPVGSILLLDGTKDDFANKKMCFPKDGCSPMDECTYLLDGQQRVTSLKSMFTDLFLDLNDWKFTWDSIYKDLRNRWFIRVIPKENEEDIFGYDTLIFNGLNSYEPNQIVDYIECKPIFKTKLQDWYNPGFIVKDNNDNIISIDDTNLRNLIISKFAAGEGLVPLYTLYKKDKTKALHEYVVERIGREKIESIKAHLMDLDEEQKKIELKKYLAEIEPNIDLFIKSNDESGINSAWSNLSAKWSRDIINYLEGIMNEIVPTTELPSDEINRAVAIFESINKGGTPLDTFDLIVAKAAKDKSLESLSKRLLFLLQEKVELSNAITGTLHDKIKVWFTEYVGLTKDNEISKFVKSQFLNMLSILSNTEYGIVDEIKSDYVKKNQILKLNSQQINSNTEKTIKALIRACSFLQLRCGIVHVKELPYELMILPIAYCLIDDKKWNDKKSVDKIEYWYWSCLFGGAYRERQNEQSIKDMKNLYKWIDGKIDNPFDNYYQMVLKDPGYSDINLLLMKDETHEVQSSVRKAILQYILSQEPKDFIFDELYLTSYKVGAEGSFNFQGNNQLIKIEDHHIIPLKNATKIGQSSKEIRSEKKHILNSPLNRTYISSYSNIQISDMKPVDYFNYVSEVAMFGHCISNNIGKIFEKEKEEDEFYMNILELRFDEIYKTLIMELDKLKA
ncbi:hypothetical protein J2Z76_001122 [Sedimentibacter acidaminivorans]|uniref:GmrSD restriction endonucleases N-terminal domain-containing protein n=1 Tax=Sedimentibacter acidaminivorans TaxID=913099 RepID=A0ABS4GC49_9FIRM|nr:DUF262 domain-containing protein [Sedimentibacter acidaminivorans]MBP1925265.1 hypothetical protein [Sedimentibacter acidaminivorans]